MIKISWLLDVIVDAVEYHEWSSQTFHLHQTAVKVTHHWWHGHVSGFDQEDQSSQVSMSSDVALGIGRKFHEIYVNVDLKKVSERTLKVHNLVNLQSEE